MKQLLTKFFLRSPSHWQFWVVFAFLCKGLIFLFLICRNDLSTLPGFRGVIGGDTPSYFQPIDDLIAYGNYTPDFRMPGYGILYIPFAFFFSKCISYNCIIICQFVVASLTVYPLALIAKGLFKSNRLFYLTFYLFAISTYTNLFDSTLYTESFTTSFLILAVFYFLKAIQQESKINLHLFISGLLLTEVIFLRPVFMPVILLFSIVLLVYYFKHKTFKKPFLKLLLLLSPFLFFEGAWIARNYIKHDKFLPTTTSNGYPGVADSYYPPLYTFVRSWGGSDQTGEPMAEIRWFGLHDVLPPQLHNVKVSLPNDIYTSKFNYDSLLVLRNQLTEYISGEDKPSTVHSQKRETLLATIRAKCLLYAASVKNERPFLYYFKAPLKRTKAFLVHSGTPNLFLTLTPQLGPVSYIIKVFYSLLYLGIISLGIIGILLLSMESLRLNPVVLITGLVIYTIIIHPIILGTCEKRFFVPAYPFMLVCAVFALNWIWSMAVKRALTN
jgi:hypothetical protein